MSENKLVNNSSSTSSLYSKSDSVHVILSNTSSGNIQNYPSNTYPPIVIENGKPRYSTQSDEIKKGKNSKVHPILYEPEKLSIKHAESVVKTCDICGFFGYPLIGQRIKTRSCASRCCYRGTKKDVEEDDKIEYFYQCEQCGRIFGTVNKEHL